MVRAFQERRQPFVIRSDLTPGANARSTIQRVTGALGTAQSVRDGHMFSRLHVPNLQVLVIGSGPAASGIAVLASYTGFTVKVWTNDDATQDAMASRDVGGAAFPVSGGSTHSVVGCVYGCCLCLSRS